MSSSELQIDKGKLSEKSQVVTVADKKGFFSNSAGASQTSVHYKKSWIL